MKRARHLGAIFASLCSNNVYVVIGLVLNFVDNVMSEKNGFKFIGIYVWCIQITHLKSNAGVLHRYLCSSIVFIMRIGRKRQTNSGEKSGVNQNRRQGATVYEMQLYL